MKSSSLKNKVCCGFIASYYGPYYSNFVASIFAFEKIMKKNGNGVIYIFPLEIGETQWVSELKKINNRVFLINYSPYSIKNLIEIRKIFKENRVNIIYSHMCGWDITAHFAAPLTPIIWHMRMGVNVTDKKKRIKNWLKFRMIGFGKTYHIAVSQPVTDAINSLNPRHKCYTIYNALEFDRLLEKSFSFPQKPPYKMLIFGWQPEVKGLDITLSACEVLNKEKVIIKLIISSQEKTYKYINSRYRVCPDWLILEEPTSNVSTLYSNADMMISASRSEGFSYSLAEAIYSGLPVIYSDIPGTRWADEFKGTYSFHSEDVEDLIRAIKNCIRNNISKDQQIQNRKIMREKYSMDSWLVQVTDFINEIMK